ncbi:reticulon-4-interacting protein 1 homolog, mitochondrial isoform X1 [Frankliniella occidentalis]|uniref:Reticulon-4-interacting protein 1 homolog, mitochondrial isoform X1 n=1 Tax=Frankliniella occidentalis TaxID=133901 RepID=A0A6J1RZL7_FRAOC|nr:reticulon-4-interacting protein 1 homolog, mitochondrial isoform X1 [Frankliniella occidentalis]XP_026274241.1 reticulon-4-interacting protein 1 homolog, mitochondrial isoform X1 [Frankliniella occidentalis]XP_026274242.1 reticulon-4-interacting protein 1 homolog, mitochondrial isoform X1 [Frankliniella occidentalis]
MDEVAFHLNQRLEFIQVQLLSAIQHGNMAFQSRLHELHNLALVAIESNQVTAVRQTFNSVWEKFVHLIREVRSSLPQSANPVVLYDEFMLMLGNELNRRNFYTGCVGFALGGMIGLVVGMSLHSTPTPSQRIRGVVCIDYRGLDAVSTSDDVPMPVVTAPDQLLIEVRAASLDYLDIKICSGYGRVLRRQLHKYTPSSPKDLPFVLGRDCSGVVVDIGHDVKNFEIGDEVWLAVPYWASGTLAQYVVARERQVARKPRGIGFEGAAALPFSGSVAWDAMVNQAKLNSHNTRGKRVLVHCGSSPVGCVVTQLARLWGANVTVTCPARALTVCNALGADDTIVFEEGPVDKQLATRKRFDVVFNTLGAVVHESCLRFCNDDGIVVTTVATRIASDSYGFILGALYALWVKVQCLVLKQERVAWGAVHLNSDTLNELARLVDNGQLQPVVDKIFSPRDVELAFQHTDSAQAIGKTVIRFSGFGYIDDDNQSTRSRSSVRSSKPDILS